jgi:membrane associated rhomboid family serine protease
LNDFFANFLKVMVEIAALIAVVGIIFALAFAVLVIKPTRKKRRRTKER